MRKSIVFVIALAASAVLAETASARTRPLVSKPIAIHVFSACGNAGGKSYSNASGYGCSVKNCDGKGGECRVDCKNGGNCTGTTPARVIGSLGIQHILTNGAYAQTSDKPKGVPGYNLLGSSGGFTAQAPSGVGSPMTPPKPVAPPPPQIR